MPCGYHINNDDGLVLITAKTDVDIADVHQMAHTILKDPDFDPALPQLVDLRGLNLEATRSGTEEFRDFLLLHYRPAAYASMAIIVDDSFDSRSLAELYRVTSNMPKTELFDDYEQALKWLMRREFQTRTSA